ncbi:FIST signal transduction protein [Jannaschia marina]|uniref:FIST signal transduction protein n=1 Tax=Jannaschia marina TaxID=2741674 RepID=UPI0015C9EC56|nr:FIST N-terminal domain-containing protein [Jannaschia marina]
MEIDVVVARSAGELAAKLSGTDADFVSVHGDCGLDVAAAAVGLGLQALHGATSCLGAMTGEGPTDGLAAFVLRDPAGAYGTALATFGDDPAGAAARATRAALENADRPGEQPDLVWVSATPGAEEEVLAGIESVIGRDIPIIGGSAADNAVAGGWFVYDGSERTEAGVVVSALFPSRPISFAYQSGYAPTEHAGTVTRAEGRRIHEIDGRPALEVYAEWTEGAIDGPAAHEASVPILSESTLWPLGREIAGVGAVPFYLLAHPAVAQADGAIDLFATVAEGEALTLMSGTQESLIARAGRVAALARATGGVEETPVAGALMIYCGGCMLSVRDRVADVAAGVDIALDGAPFLGAFTFGEQGALLGAGNRHGNLMISCIVFH